MSELSHYVAAAVMSHIATKQKSSFLTCRTADDVRQSIISEYNVALPISLIRDGLAKIVEVGAAKEISDPYTQSYIVIAEASSDSAFTELSVDETSVFHRAKLMGRPWLQEALVNIGLREFPDEHSADPGDWESAAVIPASDRVVLLTDNSDGRDEIVNKIDALSEAVRTHNDENGNLADRERLLSENEAGKTLLKSPTVRVRALWAVLAPGLLFLSTTFAEGAIGQLAAELLQALKLLLGL